MEVVLLGKGVVDKVLRNGSAREYMVDKAYETQLVTHERTVKRPNRRETMKATTLMKKQKLYQMYISSDSIRRLSSERAAPARLMLTL